MAAHGAQGNPTAVLLAASAVSLDKNIELAFRTIAAAEELALGEVYSEAGYMKTLRRKWEREMAEVQADNTQLKAENTDLKQKIDSMEAQLGVLRQQMAAALVSHPDTPASHMT